MAYENKYVVPNRLTLWLRNAVWWPRLMQNILKTKHVCNFCVNKNKCASIANKYRKLISLCVQFIYFGVIIRFQSFSSHVIAKYMKLFDSITCFQSSGNSKMFKVNKKVVIRTLAYL